ncbi:hypothetical protein AWC38_SpisGene22960 [Stylophora pistillata]|uniref:Uncharacterized protein n=1 Tax=Stylophora pistillata TaxID=50429 RepID=A0A2B4R922_STYPI|nr:hypothetical protein AWC38_SpisGene22960 [Stylophora pistillata]
MEGCCSFQVIVGGVCGYNPNDRTRNSEIVPLLSCKKDIDSHKSTYKFTGPEDEVELILCRAGKFSKSESLRTMTICRTKLGLGWSRGSSTRCRVPEEISGYRKGKGLWPKGERGLGKNEYEAILRKTNLFVDSDEVTFNLDNVRPILQTPQGPMRDAETPTTFYQPSESFTTPSGDNFGTITSREKLNLFLASRDISPSRHVMVTPWEEAAERTKRFHRRKTRQVVFAALEEIAPNSASNEDASDIDSTLLGILVECYQSAGH